MFPKLRFKEFDGDWLKLKYKDVLTIKYGKDHKSLNDGDIPVLGTGGIMRYVDSYLYDGESILIGRKGTIDKPQYINEKFWTVDTLFYTEIKENIVPLFLFQHALEVNWLGLNEATVKKYIREQELHDQMKDKLSVKEYEDPFKGSK